VISQKIYTKILELQKLVEEMRTEQKIMAEDFKKLKNKMLLSKKDDKEFLEVNNFYYCLRILQSFKYL
jgi:hypothetical protein